MPGSDEVAGRRASERARDELNRQIRHPPAAEAQEVDLLDSSPKGEDRKSYFNDPSTKDGQLRWD
jgi:hypothetical protein